MFKRLLGVASLVLALGLNTNAFAICTMNGSVSSSSLGIVTAGDLNFGNWTPSTAYLQGALFIDSNGNTQHVTTAGTSGAAPPTWSTTLNGTTSDGSETATLVQIGRASGTNPTSAPVISRHYLQIQNTGITNPMEVSMGSNNNATAKDVYLGPGANWVLTMQGGALVPAGDISAISASGTTYSFCDY